MSINKILHITKIKPEVITTWNSSFIALKYHYFCDIITEHIDTFVPSWHRFENSVAVEIQLLAFVTIMSSCLHFLITVDVRPRTSQWNNCNNSVSMFCHAEDHTSQQVVWVTEATVRRSPVPWYWKLHMADCECCKYKRPIFCRDGIFRLVPGWDVLICWWIVLRLADSETTELHVTISLNITNKMQHYKYSLLLSVLYMFQAVFSAHHQELKNCTHSIRYMSSLLAATASDSSKQAVYSFWAPDDGQKNCLEHIENWQ